MLIRELTNNIRKPVNELAPALMAMLPTLGWAVAELLLNPSKTAKWDTTDPGAQIYNKLANKHGDEVADNAATEFNKRLSDQGPTKELLQMYQNIVGTSEVPMEFNSLGTIGENGTIGGIVSANVNVGNAIYKPGKLKRGRYGAPKAPQAKNKDGTVKNALTMKGGGLITGTSISKR